MKRWPAFSLVEMAVVLMITGLLLTGVPALVRIHKTIQAQQQMDLALKSLGAYVAQNHPLPEPDPPRSDEEFILRGTLPYKKLGMKRKGPMIQYAVDRTLTSEKLKLGTGFCGTDLANHFTTDFTLEDDIIAFELSTVGIKAQQITRYNFAAQYSGTVCKMPLKPRVSELENARPSRAPDVDLDKLKSPTDENRQLSPEEA